MRKLISALFVAVLAVRAGADDLNARLEKIVKSHSIARQNLGLSVLDLDHPAQAEVFGLNDKQPFTPASVTKLATASAVLERLGPSFKFQTTLWSSGTVKGGVLHGDLVLKGGGDAGFVSETMWFLVNEFMRTGIQRIDGNVIVDDGDFDAIRADPSRDPERVDRAYDAPVGAMSFNWNSINIFVRPTQIGEPAQVYLDPLTDYFLTDNKAKTVNKAGSSLEISRTNHSIAVHGTIGISHDEVVAYKNVDDPADWSGKNLVFFLSQRGITVSGKVKTGRKPDGAKQLAKADSKPVANHVADMLKFSNNYVAEMLTKDLAAQNGSTPASLEDGMKLIREHLNSIGIDSKNFVLLNPSGLSRKNRMRPRDLAEILAQAQKNFPTFGELLASLPLAGLDGTLKKRMAGTSAEGWVRGKTGSLAGIVSLAGYAGRKDGGLRAFAFIFNGKAEQGESARHLFDALATALVE
jgi:D-alanyl-D-alanine carboxypeptidase/D-alanyl-D-alanine-endopeptidase (penicillin-binding protein 4)